MKLYMFRTIPLSIIRNFSLYIQKWYMSYRFVDSFRAAGSGRNCSSILILPESFNHLAGWSMDWIDVAQDKDQLQALVNVVMNIRVL
jgi:hypothetical protein